jgi:putative tryptophan/tyrosine transport system substrate-binding protein
LQLLLAVSPSALDTRNEPAQRGLSWTLNQLGDVLLARHDLAAAIQAHEEGLGIGRHLAALDPNDARAQDDLSRSLKRIGSVLLTRARDDLMKRRDFISLLGGAVAAWPLPVRAQQRPPAVIGFLSSSALADRARYLPPFRQGIRETGYVEGQNVGIEYRWAEDQYDRLPDLAADLVGRQVTVIVAHDTPAAVAAKAATTTVPIVFSSGGDPVKLGLVPSLNRPGGNVTGVTFILAELGAKHLGLLHELQPGAVRVGVLVDPNFPFTASFISDVQAAASSIRKQIEVLEAPTGRDIDTAFASLAQKPIDALLVGPSPLLNNRRVQLVTLAAYHRVPEAGGLMSYGTSLSDAYRQAGVYTGRILKGEKPADLPVIQSSKFDFVINLTTAKTLGLEVPPGLSARADEVIE